MTEKRIHPLRILIKDHLPWFIQVLHDNSAFRWISRSKKHIGSLPYLILVGGFGCWVYYLLDLEVGSTVSSETNKAMILLFLAASGSASVLACTSLLSRSAYYLYLKRSLGPSLNRLSLFAKPVCFAVTLFTAFSYGDHIRAAGIASYSHIAGIVQTSQLHTQAVKRYLPDLREIV